MGPLENEIKISASIYGPRSEIWEVHQAFWIEVVQPGKLHCGGGNCTTTTILNQLSFVVAGQNLSNPIKLCPPPVSNKQGPLLEDLQMVFLASAKNSSDRATTKREVIHAG